MFPIFKNKKRKLLEKIFSGTLVAFILMGILFFAVPGKADAQEGTATGPNITDYVAGVAAGFVPGGAGVAATALSVGAAEVKAGVLSSLTNEVALFLSQIVLTVTSWTLYAGGLIFGEIINLSVLKMGTFVESEGVNAAWRTFRDLANMVFIFVLLWIAINTILGTGGVDMRKMVARVVIVALLLNFSLFFTKLAVDASNILTIGFYNQIIQTDCRDQTGNVANVGDAFACKLGVASFYSPENLKTINAATGGGWNAVMKNVVMAVMGSIFFVITAFIFFAAAIMFIMRFITIIFLLILSPLAFVAMALPKDKYSGDWVGKLIKNCLFAPAFMAMAWAVLQISDAVARDATGVTSLAAAVIGDANGQPLPGAGAALLNYAILIALIMGCLVVANEFGAHGAEKALGTIKGYIGKSQQWMQNRVRGAALLPVKGAAYVGGEAKDYAKYRAGMVAEKFQKSNTGFAKAVRAVPGATQAIGTIGKNARGVIEAQKARSDFKGLSEDTLKNMAAEPLRSPVEKAAILAILAEKGNLKPERGLTAEAVKRVADNQKKVGSSDAKSINALSWQFAQNQAERVTAIKGDRNRSIPTMAPAVLEKLDLNQYFDVTPGVGSPVRTAMYETFHGEHIKNMMNRTDDAFDRFIDNLKADLALAGKAQTVDDLADWFGTDHNNRRLAKWASEQAGRDTLNRYGFT